MVAEALVDDDSIANSAELWRRIIPQWIVFDDNTGGVRVSSAAFDNSSDGSPTSVWLAEVIERSGRKTQDLLSRFSDNSLASLTAGQAREHKQGIAQNPLPDEPAHAFLFGPKTKGIKKNLARVCQWVIPPKP